MEKAGHFTDWLTVVLLLLVFIIGFLHYYYPKRFSAFIKLPFNSSYFTDLQQEKSSPAMFSIFIEAVLILGLGVFVYLIISNNGKSIAPDDYILFVRIILVAFLIVTVQRFFHSLTGVLFDMKGTFNRFVQVKDGHLQWAVLWLTVLSLIYIYSPLKYTGIIYLGLAFLAVLYIAGVTKASLLVANKNLNGLQLFFYLCALEILPVITLVKLVMP